MPRWLLAILVAGVVAASGAAGPTPPPRVTVPPTHAPTPTPAQVSAPQVSPTPLVADCGSDHGG